MASLFRPALDLMAMCAAYHRDRRNIATHLVGIPMIVFAIAVLLAAASSRVMKPVNTRPDARTPAVRCAASPSRPARPVSLPC